MRGVWLVAPKKDHSAQLVGRRLLQLIDCLVSCWGRPSIHWTLVMEKGVEGVPVKI